MLHKKIPGETNRSNDYFIKYKTHIIKELFDLREFLLNSLSDKWRQPFEDSLEEKNVLHENTFAKTMIHLSKEMKDEVINDLDSAVDFTDFKNKEFDLKNKIRKHLSEAVEIAHQHRGYFRFFSTPTYEYFHIAMDRLGNSLDISRLKKHIPGNNLFTANNDFFDIGDNFSHTIDSRLDDAAYLPNIDKDPLKKLNDLHTFLRCICDNDYKNTNDWLDYFRQHKRIIDFFLLGTAKSSIDWDFENDHKKNYTDFLYDLRTIREICPVYVCISIAAILNHIEILRSLLKQFTTESIDSMNKALAADVKTQGETPYNTIPNFNEYIKILETTTCRNEQALTEIINPEVIKLLEDKAEELQVNSENIKKLHL